MNPGMRMLMMQRMAESRPKSEYGGGNRRMIGYDRNDHDYRGGHDGGMRSGYESRFDNRYENRYDMNGGYEDNYNTYGGGYDPPENRSRRSPRTGRYIRGVYGGMDDDDDEMERDYPPRMQGGSRYGDIYARGTIYAPNAMNRPMGMDKTYGPVDQEQARMWVEKMSGGEHFKTEVTEPHRQATCPECEKWEFYVAMNAAYSDHNKTAKKINMDRPEYYAMLARDFLEDEDAGPHKLQKYMETIPK